LISANALINGERERERGKSPPPTYITSLKLFDFQSALDGGIISEESESTTSFIVRRARVKKSRNLSLIIQYHLGITSSRLNVLLLTYLLTLHVSHFISIQIEIKTNETQTLALDDVSGRRRERERISLIDFLFH
jgi:hypothetical protein